MNVVDCGVVGGVGGGVLVGLVVVDGLVGEFGGVVVGVVGEVWGVCCGGEVVCEELVGVVGFVCDGGVGELVGVVVVVCDLGGGGIVEIVGYCGVVVVIVCCVVGVFGGGFEVVVELVVWGVVSCVCVDCCGGEVVGVVVVVGVDVCGVVVGDGVLDDVVCLGLDYCVGDVVLVGWECLCDFGFGVGGVVVDGEFGVVVEVVGFG